MKATGIVRRIDDLGRIVIPKEVRRMLAVKEGDPMEIFIDGEGSVFRKYLTEESVRSNIDILDEIIQEYSQQSGSVKVGELQKHIKDMKSVLNN